jgi:hypothetical protein
MDNNVTYFTPGALPETSLRQVSVHIKAQGRNLMHLVLYGFCHRPLHPMLPAFIALSIIVQDRLSDRKIWTDTRWSRTSRVTSIVQLASGGGTEQKTSLNTYKLRSAAQDPRVSNARFTRRN